MPIANFRFLIDVQKISWISNEPHFNRQLAIKNQQ